MLIDERIQQERESVHFVGYRLQSGGAVLIKQINNRFVQPMLNGGRRSGVWSHADIEWMADQVADIPGDLAEIGVFRGRAFQKVARLAHAQGKMAHAFDSFVGISAPGPEDGQEYPAGTFDVGGPEGFARLMQARGVERELYQLHPGYIPDCFKDVDPSLRFSLVILDVDHYDPTVDALRWVWPRINVGGVLALDDFIPGYKLYASKAIKEFLRKSNDFDIIDFFNHQLILQKIEPGASE